MIMYENVEHLLMQLMPPFACISFGCASAVRCLSIASLLIQVPCCFWIWFQLGLCLSGVIMFNLVTKLVASCVPQTARSS